MFQSIIAGVVTSVIGGLINSPSVPISQQDPQAISATRVVVEKAVREELAPVIAHATNNEPWYQSRVTLGSAAAVIAGVAAAFGRNWDTVTVTNVLVSAGPIVGGLVSLYGRWAARKPIGA